MKNILTKERRWILILIMCVADIICLFLFFNSFLSISLFGTYYYSDVDCINASAHGSPDWTVDKIMFKYTNDKQELVIFKAEDGSDEIAVLDTKIKNGKPMYRLESLGDSLPIFNLEWKNIGDDFALICRDRKEDLAEFSTQGYTPIMEEIEYQFKGRNETCYLYFIDKSQKINK